MNVRLGTFTECGSRARGFRREGLVVATRAREKMCAVNVPVEAVIASGHPFLAQSPNLCIRDQPVLRKENGQSHTLPPSPMNRPIPSSATGKNNCR